MVVVEGLLSQNLLSPLQLPEPTTIFFELRGPGKDLDRAGSATRRGGDEVVLTVDRARKITALLVNLVVACMLNLHLLVALKSIRLRQFLTTSCRRRCRQLSHNIILSCLMLHRDCPIPLYNGLSYLS